MKKMLFLMSLIIVLSGCSTLPKYTPIGVSFVPFVEKGFIITPNAIEDQEIIGEVFVHADMGNESNNSQSFDSHYMLTLMVNKAIELGGDGVMLFVLSGSGTDAYLQGYVFDRPGVEVDPFKAIYPHESNANYSTWQKVSENP